MSTLKVNTISDASGNNSSSAESLNKGTCKMWINYNGTGTVAIRQSYNVSSLDDEGVGRYTVNFSNAVPVADYAAFVTHSFGSTEKGGSDDGDHINGMATIRRTSDNTTTTKLKIVGGHDPGTNTQDGAQCCAGVFC